MALYIERDQMSKLLRHLYYKPGEKHKYKELSCLFIVTTHVLCWVNGYLPDINS
jgi:hypothetical protein